MKTQTVAHQIDTPSVAVPTGATAVIVTGHLAKPIQSSLVVRRELRGKFLDGSTRTILTQEWPAVSMVETTSERAVRVWVHEDPSLPVGIGEEVVFQ